MWHGSAAVCVNEEGKLLMVKQGKAHEPKVWACPSGGLEPGETHAECCVREVWEETGYRVEVREELFVKTGVTYGIEVTVRYFAVEAVGGAAAIQDPDGLIDQVAWKSAEEIATLTMGFPEDRAFLIEYLTKKERQASHDA